MHWHHNLHWLRALNRTQAIQELQKVARPGEDLRIWISILILTQIIQQSINLEKMLLLHTILIMLMKLLLIHMIQI
uniref:Mov34/MPN/PAD-1 family protein n=1 Tax=Arundo donax TaxID=35708 RepID=A0A0A9HVJ3_ARUDO